MQYLIIRHTGKKWIADTIVTVRYGGGQKTAINQYKKENIGITGEYWIFPLSHSAFYEFKRGKLINKHRFYSVK